MLCLFCIGSSVAIEKYHDCNFWKDLGRSRPNLVFYYHMRGTAMTKSSRLNGWAKHEGKFHKLLNNDLLKMCREYPLSLFCHQIHYMQMNGAGDLANLKPRVIRCVAEHIIR
jgi:hypothetical protein